MHAHVKVKVPRSIIPPVAHAIITEGTHRGSVPSKFIVRNDIMVVIVFFLILFLQLTSASASSQRSKPLPKTRTKSTFWLVQGRGPLTVAASTLPPLPCLYQESPRREKENEEVERVNTGHEHCTIETCPQKRFLLELSIHLNRLELSDDRYM